MRPVGTEPVSETLAIAGWAARAAPTGAAALHDVEGAGGQAGLGEDLAELQRAERA